MRRLPMGISLGLVLAGCGGQGAVPTANEVRPGTILMKLRSESLPQDSAQAKSLLYDAGAVNKDELPNSVQRVNLAPSHEGNEEEFCKQLVASGAVEFAEPDYKLPLCWTPNDPSYSQQWFHTKISSAAAWDIARGNSSVVVAVCDTGVQANHSDLAANLLPGFNSVDGTNNTTPVHPHGTMVSGCISALGNNGLGGAGVAFGVKVLPIRVSSSNTGSAYLSDMATGVRWAADHGARVINLSYSGAQYATIDQAAQYARGRGALLFMAAGNEGLNVTSTYPDYPSFVLVGSTNPSDGRSTFSNYGTAVDMVAPGESIFTTTTNNGYASVAGTSFASPIAAAGAALVLSYKPSLTPSELETAILSSCDDIGATGDDGVFGRGRLNVAAALRRVTGVTSNQAPRAVVSASPSAGRAPLAVTWNGGSSSDPENTPLTYAWRFSDGGAATGPVATRSYAGAGTFRATLTVTDAGGATSTANATVVVSPDPNAIIAPTNLQASGSGTTVNLQWNDNSNNESGFYVERSSQNTRPGVYVRVATVSANRLTYVDRVTRGTYLYRVQAYNATRTSNYTSVITVVR